MPEIDPFSFWLGFGAAALIAWLLYAQRRPLGQARQWAANRWQAVRESFTSGTERRFREESLRAAQTAHLAGALFALDDILITPRLLAPEPPADPAAADDDEDVSSIIPVMMDLPELTGAFQARTASVDEVFGGAEDVVVLGPPGAGKTTLLSHLVTRALHEAGRLFPENVTPILVHAADLELPRAEKDDAAQPLIAAAQARASALTAPRLPGYLRLRLQRGKCLILLDGLDEMPPAQVAQVAGWLKEFRRAHAGQRVIAAAGPWGFGPLLEAGLVPVVLAPYTRSDLQRLAENWCLLWERVAASRRRKGAPPEVDPHIMLGWLANGDRGLSVFETTLRIWTALAGDTRGGRPVDWLEAHLLRHNLSSARQAALGRLAMAMLAQEDALGLPRAEAAGLCDAALAGPADKAEVDSDDFLDDLVNRGLLARHARGRLSFRHSLAASFYAARAMAASPEAVTPGPSPAWARALYFYSALGDLTPVVGRALLQAADLLHSDLVASALWLRHAPAGARWRGEVFKRLARVMLDGQQPEALRVRALAGFVAAGDASVTALFRQALASPDPFSRRLAALGLGALGDAASIPQLSNLFADGYVDVRWAACLALAVIGTEPAIDALAAGLLQGDDNLRRGCAQALARNAEMGHDVLREAIGHEDIAARRAAVFGLLDTRSDWARALLESVQTNEQQWIVRSAAVEALEQLKAAGARHPTAYPPPESQGWLISWAASQGTSVPPGRGAVDVLARALREGEPPVKVAAAASLGRLSDAALARALYPALKDPAPLVRDAAYRALAHVSQAAGQRLAPAN